MSKSFKNWRFGAVHLNFPNGNHISTTWAPCSYSDNYNAEFEDFKGSYSRIEPAIESNSVEIMFDCSDKLTKKILKKYNEGNSQPIGYLNITQWSEIVALISKEIKT